MAKDEEKDSEGRAWLGLIALLGVCLAIAYFAFLTYVPPNAYGIKIRKLGLHRGVQEKIYDTGFHLVLPFAEELHTLPKDLRTLDLTLKPPADRHYGHVEPAAHIQTSDGFFVDVDVSILYRITDPFVVFTKIGPGDLYFVNGILPKAEPILKQALGELTTEEFYNSPLRVEKSLLAKKLLNEELKSKGLTVDHILVRYFVYSNEIQKNIEEKKLKDQLVFKNQAEANAAREAAILERIIEEGRKNVDVKLEEGRAYAMTIEGKIENYSRTKRSEADLLVSLADAEKTRLKNNALKSSGAAKIVGMEMAEVLKGLDVIILPSDGKQGVNPLDLNKDLKLFNVVP